MRIITKSLSIILLGSICVIMFFAGEMPLIEGYNPIRPDIDTKFSDKYSEDLFQQIKIGDDSCSVICKIGNPIDMYKINENETQWNYSTDGKCEQQDFAWLVRAVIFDENGKVVDKYKTIAYD